jgi:hypothetical protein
MARFTLALGGRRSSATRQLGDAAALITRADHTDKAAATQHLLDAGMSIEIVEEAQMADDEFAEPTKAAGRAPSDGIDRDHWGRYLLPDPETGAQKAWTRVSTVARTLADEYHLGLWAQRMAIKGLAARPDLIAAAAAADAETDRDTLDSIVTQAKDVAGSRAGANMGTALHSFTHRLDRGEALADLRAPAPLDADLAAYAVALREGGYGTYRSWIERVVVLPELGIAGTFDRILSQLPGQGKHPELTIADLKTGRTLEYSWLEMEMQLACYAHGALLWDPVARTYAPMPAVDLARGLIIHLPVGRAAPQIYGVDLVKGWANVQLAMAVRAARTASRKGGWLVKPDDAAAVALHLASNATSQAELAALWERLQPRGLWSPQVHEAAMARAAQLVPAS